MSHPIFKNALAVIAAVLISAASAHAVVRTEGGLGESKAGASETYRLQVPTEKDLPTTQVRLVVPAGVKITRFLVMPGFQRTVKTDAAGLVTEVTWRGRIAPMEFARFSFSATNPADPATLSWKVYQTYQDGSVVNWDGSDPATPASTVTVK